MPSNCNRLLRVHTKLKIWIASNTGIYLGECSKSEIPEFIQSGKWLLHKLGQIGNLQEIKEVVARMEIAMQGMLDLERSKAWEFVNKMALALFQRFPEECSDIQQILNGMHSIFKTTDRQKQTESIVGLLFITLVKIRKHKARLCSIRLVLNRMDQEQITQTNIHSALCTNDHLNYLAGCFGKPKIIKLYQEYKDHSKTVLMMGASSTHVICDKDKGMLRGLESVGDHIRVIYNQSVWFRGDPESESNQENKKLFEQINNELAYKVAEMQSEYAGHLIIKDPMKYRNHFKTNSIWTDPDNRIASSAAVKFNNELFRSLLNFNVEKFKQNKDSSQASLTPPTTTSPIPPTISPMIDETEGNPKLGTGAELNVLSAVSTSTQRTKHFTITITSTLKISTYIFHVITK